MEYRQKYHDGMKSLGLSCENAHGRDDWILRIKGATC